MRRRAEEETNNFYPFGNVCDPQFGQFVHLYSKRWTERFVICVSGHPIILHIRSENIRLFGRCLRVHWTLCGLLLQFVRPIWVSSLVLIHLLNPRYLGPMVDCTIPKWTHFLPKRFHMETHTRQNLSVFILYLHIHTTITTTTTSHNTSTIFFYVAASVLSYFLFHFTGERYSAATKETTNCTITQRSY